MQARKQIQLWRLPRDIIVFQLKRFKQSAGMGGVLPARSEKITTFIDFPVVGLDMSRFGQQASDKPIFDLKAVVNHMGTLSGGHYTAFAKHEATQQWYEFNDASCTPKSEEDLVTSASYLLVYQRRTSAVDT